MRQRIGIHPARWLALVATAAYLYALTHAPAHAKDQSTEPNRPVPGVTITQTSLQVTDETLELGYLITNSSDHDIWLCEASCLRDPPTFEPYLIEDSRTLLLRRRLGAPTALYDPPLLGSYVRLRAGHCRHESLLLPLPIRKSAIYAFGSKGKGTVYINRIVIEIGFHTSDPFQWLLDESMTKTVDTTAASLTGREFARDVPVAIYINEFVRNRNEREIFEGPHWFGESEQAVRLTVDCPNIACIRDSQQDYVRAVPPNLCSSTRVEIHYEPSMLEYFFPSPSQQSVLSPREKAYLQLQKTMVIEDPAKIKVLADDIARGLSSTTIHRNATAHVVAYRANEKVTSLTLHGDRSFVAEGGQRFYYGYGLHGLREITPQIETLELRLQCAANLKNLWHRIRLYHPVSVAVHRRSSAKRIGVYPASVEWCDTLVQVFRQARWWNEERTRNPHSCPAAKGHGCHYAMNTTANQTRRGTWCYCSRRRRAGTSVAGRSCSRLTTMIRKAGTSCSMMARSGSFALKKNCTGFAGSETARGWCWNGWGCSGMLTIACGLCRIGV